jgi:hypothetical protein
MFAPEREGECLVGAGTFSTNAPVLREATFLGDIQSGPQTRLRSAFVASEALGPPFEVVGEFPGPCSVEVHVLAASDEYFEYQRVEARKLDVRDNPFAEPVTPYSNVEGGFGVFAGVTRSSVSLDKP